MTELPTHRLIQNIAEQLNLKTNQLQAAIRLLDEGNTIPFIARYRKEMTGELDENQLRAISNQYELEKNLHQRRTDVLRLLAEQGVLADEIVSDKLVAAIESAKTLTEIDDIYRPYRPKRSTRASMAKERGLAPLCAWLLAGIGQSRDEQTVLTFAAQFVSEEKGVLHPSDALQGAVDIFAEEVADDAKTRKWIRKTAFEHGVIRSISVKPETESVYEAYYDYREPVGKIVPHRVLAINRGEKEKYLKVSLVLPQDEIIAYLIQYHIQSRHPKSGHCSGFWMDSFAIELLRGGVLDAYKRLIAPAIEREIRSELTFCAEEQAIRVFGENLKKLLMQPPIRGYAVLGVDPAYRTGCKLAAVDDTGKLFEVSVIYPTPPQNKVEDARREILRVLESYRIGLIAVGNGTASRETEAFIADCIREHERLTHQTVPYIMVSEAGASVYSASPLAGNEFPDLDVSERSAISIARRIQDPLAELVKIDPKSVGVGQYQHDVSQKRLDEKLAAIVETVVNQVGVDVNTASPSLLSYVAGLNKTAAKNIVEFRETNGRFKNRSTLAKVPRLGPKTLEQCVGFLRVPGGEEVLDGTPIHPESYGVVESLLARTGDTKDTLCVAKHRSEWIQQLRSVSLEFLGAEIGVGVPTLRDILAALEQPGRDPREDVPPPILRMDILKLEDIKVGMVLTGTVRNVVDFGVFVDVGVKNDGLVHISQLSDRYVKSPLDVVSIGDIVCVRVLQVDLQKHRLGLSMKEIHS